MIGPRPDGLSLEAVRSNYNARSTEFEADIWHTYTAREIERIIGERPHSTNVAEPGLILFAGSGGRTNGVTRRNAIHVDLSEAALSGVPGAIVGNVEQLPLRDESAEAVICVGSVINYCDAAATIAEFGRVIRNGGTLILEFESTDSFEFIFTRTFRSAVDFVTTFYNGHPEKIWVYSLRYIEAALAVAGFAVTSRVPIHILSPLRLRFSNAVSEAFAWSFLDNRLRRVPVLRGFACNFVLFCERTSRTSVAIR